ncbi:MAG: hypothetical protein U1E63_02950 [Burkholderiales bacterium]
MKLMYAALMRARQGWRNVIITPFEIRQIQTLRDHLRNEFEQRHASPLKSAPAHKFTARRGLDRRKMPLFDAAEIPTESSECTDCCIPVTLIRVLKFQSAPQ